MLGKISSSVDQPDTLKSIPSTLKLLEKLLENDISTVNGEELFIKVHRRIISNPETFS